MHKIKYEDYSLVFIILTLKPLKIRNFELFSTSFNRFFSVVSIVWGQIFSKGSKLDIKNFRNSFNMNRFNRKTFKKSESLFNFLIQNPSKKAIEAYD